MNWLRQPILRHPAARPRLAHCTLAFFLNTTVPALTISIAAGVLQN